MIKHNDLMSGNFFNVPNDSQSPFRVDYFDLDKVYQKTNDYECSFFGKIAFHPLTWHISDLIPIPLTPEILEKCGFDKATDKFGGYLSPLHKGGRIRIDKDNLWWNGCFSTEVKHLHQLQNLYYSLTNEELEFKP